MDEGYHISHKFIDSPIKGPQGGIYIYNISIYYNCFYNITKKMEKKQNKTALMFSTTVRAIECVLIPLTIEHGNQMYLKIKK